MNVYYFRSKSFLYEVMADSEDKALNKIKLIGKCLPHGEKFRLMKKKAFNLKDFSLLVDGRIRFWEAVADTL